MRGVPVESGRVKSSASAPTCGLWAPFKGILQTNGSEGSAGIYDSNLYLQHLMLLLPSTQRSRDRAVIESIPKQEVILAASTQHRR